LVNKDVVSEVVVLLLLLEETATGAITVEDAAGGAVAPRMGTFRTASRSDPEVMWGKVLAAVFRAGGGLAERSGWAAMKALKLGSDFESGIFQGNRLRTIHRKMMATDQTSVFLGS
jgi:hypothetical protein